MSGASVPSACMRAFTQINDSSEDLTCQVHPSSASEVAPDQLPQIVASSLVPKPVTQPAWLMSHQDGLIVFCHALISKSGKVPVPNNSFVQGYSFLRASHAFCPRINHSDSVADESPGWPDHHLPCANQQFWQNI